MRPFIRLLSDLAVLYLLQVMGHETTMNNSIVSSSSDSTTLAVPKLHDNGSNWADYEPRIQNAMGMKGLWRHVLGTAIAPVPYAMSNGVPMLADGKTPATEDQIESKESNIIEFKKRKYLAQHFILSTTLMHLETRIKGLLTAKAMWKEVKEDATSKSTLYLLDAEDQLASMKLADYVQLKIQYYNHVIPTRILQTHSPNNNHVRTGG